MRTICYYPELVQITGSINAALMMAQLEFWFKIMEGKPFYKFLEPCGHNLYKVGDSWSEELGMTISEVRSAFKRIGTMYKSKSAFLAAMESQDIFKGKPYAAYYDRIRKTTYYIRNEEKVKDMMSDEVGEECTRSAKRNDSVHNSIVQNRIVQVDSSYNLFSVTEEKSSRLYREDLINNNIDDSIQESLSIPFEEIINLYNDNLGESLGYIRQLNQKDKNNIQNLWYHHSIQLEEFKKAFIKAATSKFLCGKIEGKKWRASLKWLLVENHLIKVLEGFYDDFKTVVTTFSSYTGLEKIKHFNEMESHHFDFEEIERLERLYIDTKLEELQCFSI